MSEPVGAVNTTTVDVAALDLEIDHRRNEPLRSSEPKSTAFSNERKKSLRARYYYGIIFLLTNLVAWFVRDYGQKVIPELLYLKSCGSRGIACFQTMGVLRVSLGCFIFFFLMFLTTLNTKKLHDIRNIWHSGWWIVKFFILMGSMTAPMLFPSNLIQLYGEFARVGAGIFLVLQLISVIQFIAWWNNHWMPDRESKRSCSIGLVMSTIFYVASVGGIIMVGKFYASGQSLNIFFIAWTGILLVVMLVISLHSKVNRGLLSSGIMGLYIVFLCWSAIRRVSSLQYVRLSWRPFLLALIQNPFSFERMKFNWRTMCHTSTGFSTWCSLSEQCTLRCCSSVGTSKIPTGSGSSMWVGRARGSKSSTNGSQPQSTCGY
ncbi:hypothetical protein BT93_H0228 [Corymbia citriodora subsp. variegata]|nr:hypothetical protein BT93_H0228 [Corymbia citriodora subsp. variegata]